MMFYLGLDPANPKTKTLFFLLSQRSAEISRPQLVWPPPFLLTLLS